MQGGYNAVRSPASYGPRPVSSYGPRPASSYGPRAQGGYAARPQYQQGSSAYYPPSAGQGQNTSQYSYARQQPQQQQGGGYNYQPQQQQQQGGGGYNYQQPAPAYQPAPTGYPAPAAQGYQSPAQGYQAPYNPPAQHGYRPPADPQAVSAYGTAQGRFPGCDVQFSGTWVTLVFVSFKKFNTLCPFNFNLVDLQLLCLTCNGETGVQNASPKEVFSFLRSISYSGGACCLAM